MLRNCSLSFVGGILFCWFVLQPLIYKLTHPLAPRSYKDVVITKVVTKKDTVYIPRLVEKTLVLSIPVAKVVDTTMLDTIRVDSYAKKRYAANFTRKTYEDTVEVEKNVSVGYKADVTGILNNMSLSYRDARPQLVIHDSTTVEKTVVKDKSNGLYLGVGGNSSLRYVGPHVMYLDRQGNAFRVGVNALSLGKPGVPEVSVGFSKRLF